jgi:hypothetical protein
VLDEPAEALTLVAADLRRFEEYDFYRLPIPADLSGVHAFAAALIRLENHERMHPGRLPDVVAFLKGEALLCLREYGAAARAFEEAMRAQTELAATSQRRREFALLMLELTRLPPGDLPVAEAIDALDRRREAILRRAEATTSRPEATLLRIETEGADVDWARAVSQARPLRADGIEAMVAAWRDVIRRHPRSNRRYAHRLALADEFSRLLDEYLEANPATTLRFDRAQFETLANEARRLYLEVAQADGFSEKLVGRARLEALSALVEETVRHVP